MNRWDLDPLYPAMFPWCLRTFPAFPVVCNNAAALRLAGIDGSYPEVPHSVGTIGRTPDGDPDQAVQ